jgi:capsular polysaccharide biosynthesis protein
MDLALYGRVLWRFKILVAAGLAFAVALAFLSYVKVSISGKPHIAYRQVQTWQSQETLLITSRQLPWVRTSNQQAGGLSYLSAFYAQLANSDQVLERVRRGGPLHGTITTQPGYSNSLRTPLPFVTIAGNATSPARAVSLAERGAAAFRAYIVSLEDSANVPAAQRVQLSVMSAARNATLVQPRKKTLPIVIFLTILVATIGLAFILENLRPRVQVVETLPEPSRVGRQSA